MKPRRVAAFAASTLATFVLGTASVSFAYTKLRRVPGSDCTPINDAHPFDGGMRMHYVSDGAACAFHDEYGLLEKTDVETIAVYVWDGSSTTYVTAKACIRYAGSLGWSCGQLAQTTTSSTGAWTLYPNESVWTNNPTNFAYLDVRVWGGGSPTNTQLMGYKAYD